MDNSTNEVCPGVPRVALVTGGTKGIGRAIAEALLREGWHVAICARQTPHETVTGGLDNTPAHMIAADLRDPPAVEATIAATLARFGRLDLLVNNAGGTPFATVADSTASLLQKVVALNLLAPLYLAKAAHPALRATQGSIVNIASISGRRPAPGTVAYGAAKAGLIAATEGLAMEWAPDVRCNAVVIGLVDNPDQAEHYGQADKSKRLARLVPMQRLARGEDVANCVLWLSSPAASYITGAAIELHGGGEMPAFLGLAQDEGR